jgi:hypothetical protein
MDDKTFIAEYVANETVRINSRLKEMVEATEPPSEEMRESVIADIELTLSRLQSALSHIMEHIDEDENKKETIQ